MTGDRHDLVGIGNAVVDVIDQVEDGFLDKMGVTRGIMQLVDRERGETLYASMTNRVETPGGSVANTIAGAGALGLKTAFVGRVRDDELGRFYARALEESGVDFPNPPVSGGDLPTSRSMIFVSPDGERSMNTYLGISAELDSGDVPLETCARAGLMFLEGYLFDKPQGKAAFHEAARACKQGGGRAGIAISDPFCVERHRPDFLKLIESDLDFVIGNVAEFLSLFEVETVEEALSRMPEICPLSVCTMSGDGAVAVTPDGRIEAETVKSVPVDATGAGDQFAAGFLFGLARGRDLKACLRMGHVCAGEVIDHVGPRPARDVGALLREQGLC